MKNLFQKKFVRSFWRNQTSWKRHSNDYLTGYVEVNVAMSCGQEKTQKYWDYFYGIYQEKLEPIVT